MNNAHDVVITGAGLISGAGIGLDAHMDRLLGKSAGGNDLTAFKAAPHLSDKRMLKAISHADAIGLAAVETLKKDTVWDTVKAAPEKIGVYVGAPPSGASDNAYYMDAQTASRGPDGAGSLKAFGKTCMEAKPTTLLIGLPNNVLCYAAMVLDARGPNNNYTSSSPSGLIAVMNAARRVARGQLDLAVAGGFCAYHSDPVNKGVLVAGGMAAGDVADGAAFVTLERRETQEARGAKAYATIAGFAQGSDGLGPWQRDARGAALENAVIRALRQAGLAAKDIGLVLLSGADGELAMISRVFAAERENPAVGALARAFGDLIEAGGVAELMLASRIAAGAEMPEAVRVMGPAAIDPEKKGVLVLRTSASGESASIVLRRG